VNTLQQNACITPSGMFSRVDLRRRHRPFRDDLIILGH
jgi:hypothetical protein